MEKKQHSQLHGDIWSWAAVFTHFSFTINNQGAEWGYVLCPNPGRVSALRSGRGVKCRILGPLPLQLCLPALLVHWGCYSCQIGLWRQCHLCLRHYCESVTPARKRKHQGWILLDSGLVWLPCSCSLGCQRRRTVQCPLGVLTVGERCVAGWIWCRQTPLWGPHCCSRCSLLYPPCPHLSLPPQSECPHWDGTVGWGRSPC